MCRICLGPDQRQDFTPSQELHAGAHNQNHNPWLGERQERSVVSAACSTRCSRWSRLFVLNCSTKTGSVPKQNAKLIILGGGEMWANTEHPYRWGEIFWLLVCKVVCEGKGLFLAACLCKWLPCCGIMRRLSGPSVELQRQDSQSGRGWLKGANEQEGKRRTQGYKGLW